MAATGWTEARRRAFIISTLRQGTRRFPAKYETLNEAKTEKKINTKTGRLAQHYLCNLCKNDFPAKDIQVDHIIEVVDPAVGFVDWNTYVERMFCAKENLQVVCVPCHKIKTQEANQSKKSTRKSQPTKALLVSKGSLQKKKKTSS